jgi:hypothetical protein
MAPTRGRPEALQEMADSAFETSSGNVEVLAYVDEDDPAPYFPRGVRVVRGPRVNLSECWNRLADVAVGSILHMSSDDIRFRTVGWDETVRAVFGRLPDRIGLVYGRDGIHDAKLATHGFVSREWVDTVGYFTWPEFPCDYADTWLHELAGRIGRLFYVPSILIEHLHPIVGKSEWDTTHRERLQRGRDADVAALFRSLSDRRVSDARLLEAACFSSPELPVSSASI